MLNILSFDKSLLNPFRNRDLKRTSRIIWLLMALFLVGGCCITSAEIQKFISTESFPALCLKDDLVLISNTGYRFEKPVSNRLHKASVFAPLLPWKLKSDAVLVNSSFSGETFLAFLVIILFFYYYRANGEDEESASSFTEPLSS